MRLHGGTCCYHSIKVQAAKELSLLFFHGIVSYKIKVFRKPGFFLQLLHPLGSLHPHC